ncbi:MAG: hypothetical protein J6Q51_00970, partial [Clostridia bacterium]|nr:hypothetical protein [Clostridia bacterium]
MFYPKPLVTKKVKNYTINFSAFASGMNTEVDEGILPYKYAKKCYNYTVENGALKNGIGFEPLSLPVSSDDITTERLITMEPNQSVKALWVFKYFDTETNKPDYKLLFYTEGGIIRWTNLVGQYPYTFEIASFIYSSGVPNAVNYRLNGIDVMIFSSATDGMWTYNGNHNAQKIEDGPSIVSMCLHYERLFAIIENGERNRLSFSASLDPTNWNQTLEEGGFIDMLDERG